MDFWWGREFVSLKDSILGDYLSTWRREETDFCEIELFWKGRIRKTVSRILKEKKMAILKICAADENLLDTRCRCPYRPHFKFERILKAREKYKQIQSIKWSVVFIVGVVIGTHRPRRRKCIRSTRKIALLKVAKKLASNQE